MPSWIGPWEIAIVLVLALLIFGPRKLPDLGASLGKSIRGFKKGLKETEDEVSSAVAEVREATDVSSEPQATPAAQAAPVVAAAATTSAEAPAAEAVEAPVAEAVAAPTAEAPPTTPAEEELATPVAEPLDQVAPAETENPQ